MRLRNVKNKEQIINSSSYLIKYPREYKGNWQVLFANDNPIYLEIGMGKGDFIIENAKKYPNINFIGIEKFDSVIVRAIDKIADEEIPNLKLIRMDATEIEDVFEHEIDTIYLNFSDPWPKLRHAHRRLSSHVFLKRYDKLFCNVKRIIMKTDNRHLFEYSLKEFIDYGYTIDDLCLDIYSENLVDNIPTEYEMKFSSKGFPIYMVNVSKR